jgi:tetratricopeptide (TPR) repeat protein
MPSIISGYGYDIFISYRQKDNKGDKWVSKFTEALTTELGSTFKEEVGVYFDINTYDGLLETHDVDASLKEKIRCLIFIPIISRTYCDPRSFAWEQEFKTFIDQASNDQYGLKVKLASGNVASRVLPIQIHELDSEDKSLIEKELGGPLRAIEFIYREPGVNKPLTAEDDHKKNLNNTKYIIQVNKVANAIDDIIRGMKSIQSSSAQDKTRQGGLPDDNYKEEKLADKKKKIAPNKLRWISGVAGLTILIILFLFAWPKIFKRNTLDKLRSSGERISVVVMPFRNITNDSTLNIWQDGIQFNLIASLSNSTDLKVRQTESINNLLQSKGFANYALITTSVASAVSKNLDANVFIYGDLNEVGGVIRISAQLIDSKTEEVFKSFQLDGEVKNIMAVTDSLATLIKNFLLISSLKKEISAEFQTLMPNSVEAYQSFILGYKAYFKGENLSAIKLFSQSLKIDSNFVYAYFWLSLSYANQGLFDQAHKLCLKVYDKKEQLPFELKIWANWLYARYHEKSMNEELKYAKQLLEINDRIPLTHWTVGLPYYQMNQYDKAIPEFETTLEIYKNWGTKPLNSNFYEVLIIAYHETGKYKKEKELIKKASADFPNDLSIIRRQIILSFSEGDTLAANQFINKYLSIHKSNLTSDMDIMDNMGAIYYSAGMLDKAETNFREALSMDPGNTARINELAYFLIDKDRSLTEGLELIEKALKMNPDNYIYLNTKGWGLFKMDKYEEALKFLEKSDSLKPVYDHLLFLHIQDVRKAIASKK